MKREVGGRRGEGEGAQNDNVECGKRRGEEERTRQEGGVEEH
jgi:hypothetical protein